MFGMKKSIENVMGHEIDHPHLTLQGKAKLVFYVGMPLSGVLLAADTVLYFYFKLVLNRCYGVFCLLE